MRKGDHIGRMKKKIKQEIIKQILLELRLLDASVNHVRIHERIASIRKELTFISNIMKHCKNMQ